MIDPVNLKLSKYITGYFFKNNQEKSQQLEIRTIKMEIDEVSAYNKTEESPRLDLNMNPMIDSEMQSDHSEEGSPDMADHCGCPHILIVDDDPFNLLALKGLLNQLGIFSIE